MLLCRTCTTGFGLDWERLLDATPSPLLEQWRVLYDLEPWDAERTDEAIGTLVAHLVAVHGVQPKSPAGYMRYLRREEPQSEASMKAVFEAACRAAESDMKSPDP